MAVEFRSSSAYLNGTLSPEQRATVMITVDGQKMQVSKDQTLLSALREVGVEVPTLCHRKDLVTAGACRLCVVEVKGSRTLVASCTQPVQEGMEVFTQSPRVRQSRKVVLELTLANHPDDCLYCVRNDSCELRALAAEYGVERRFRGERRQALRDVTSPALVRDPEKCILCQRCVSVCADVQSVAAISPLKRGFQTTIDVAFGDGMGESECVNCGQCSRVCPTGAIIEKDATAQVYAALADPSTQVVVQIAPAVRVSIAQEYGLTPGANLTGKLVSALKLIGFDKVYDTNFAADLTIMEEAAEFVGRVKNGGPFPLVTSCCPAWVKFAEEYYPDHTQNLSSCKSPQMMLGALLRSEYAQEQKVVEQKAFVVSVMPCTGKKWEATAVSPGDVDVVLTSREFLRMLRRDAIDLRKLESTSFDRVFGNSTGAAIIFGVTGGVAEAAIRTAYRMVTDDEMAVPDFAPVRGLDGVKTAEVDVAGITVKVAVISGLANARRFLETGGWEEYHLVEIMACPGGCINGGGQPYGDEWPLEQLMQSLYAMDRDQTRRRSHENPEIVELYEKFLGSPNSDQAHHLLHRKYTNRSKVFEPRQ